MPQPIILIYTGGGGGRCEVAGVLCQLDAVLLDVNIGIHSWLILIFIMG